MTESLVFKERPSFGNGLFISFYLFIYLFLFIETDYSASLKFLEFK